MLTEAREKRESALEEEDDDSDDDGENDVDDGTMVRRSQTEVDDGTLVKDGPRRRRGDDDTLRLRHDDDDDDDFRTAKGTLKGLASSAGGGDGRRGEAGVGGGGGTMTSMSSMVEVESSIGTMVINESSDDAESTFDEDDEEAEERRKKKKEEKNKYRPPFLDHFDRAREKEILIDRHLRGDAGDGSAIGGGVYAGLGNDVNVTLNSVHAPSFEELLRHKGESMERRFVNGGAGSSSASGGASGEVDFNTASSINSSGTFVRHHEGDTPIPSPAGTFVQHDSVPTAQMPAIGAFRHPPGVGYDESSFDPAGWTPMGPGLDAGMTPGSLASSAHSTTAANSFYYQHGSSMPLGSSAHTHPSGPMNKLNAAQQQVPPQPSPHQVMQQPRQVSRPGPPVSRCDVVDGPVDGSGQSGSRMDHAWTFEKIMQGDYDFLATTPYEELQQRLNLVDSECEGELELLKRRYHIKRRPILDAIAAKRKRQQNF